MRLIRRIFLIMCIVGLFSLLFTRLRWNFIRMQIQNFLIARRCADPWQCVVFSDKTNSFEVSFYPLVSDYGDESNSRRSSENWVLSTVFQLLPAEPQPYTFERMAEVADDNWVFPVPHSVYMLYPQALDMKQVVANITHRLPVSEAPIFNQTIRFLNVSSTVCVPGKEAVEPLDAIIMVKSGVYNFADRERIRKTYAPEAVRKAGLHVRVVFSVGLPRISGGRFFQRDGFNISLPDRAGESMENMQSQRSEVLRNLSEEARRHGDLLLGDYEDTYYNLSLKLFYTFQWASCFCRGYFTQDNQQVRPPVFIVLDDDYAFNASVLKAELRNLSDTEIRRVTWGIPFNQSKLFRYPFNKKYDKWALSKREMPWPHLAPYAPSIFLVFGVDVLQEIALAMYFTRQIPVDDAWLGLIMTKLDLYFERRPHMYKFVPKKVQKEVVLSAPYEYLYGS